MDSETRKVLEWSNGSAKTAFPRAQLCAAFSKHKARSLLRRLPLLWVTRRSHNYATFNLMYDHLAANLRSMGCASESLVALLFERGLEMMVAI